MGIYITICMGMGMDMRMALGMLVRGAVRMRGVDLVRVRIELETSYHLIILGIYCILHIMTSLYTLHKISLYFTFRPKLLFFWFEWCYNENRFLISERKGYVNNTAV